MFNEMQQPQGRELTQQEAITAEGRKLAGMLAKRRDEWAVAAKDTGMSFDVFCQGIVTAVRANPRLLEAGAANIINAADRSRALGLDCSGVTGEAWLVGPFRRKGSLTVELWKGIKGTVKLAYRSGMVRKVTVQTVYEGDDFDVDYAAEPPIRHRPAGKSDVPIATYALVSLTTGGALAGVVWGGEVSGLQAKAAARLDKGYASSPWATNLTGMVEVQAMRRALKWAPQSVVQQDLLGEVEAAPALPVDSNAQLRALERIEAPALTNDSDGVVSDGMEPFEP